MVLKLIIHCLLLTTYFTDILHSFICVDQQFSLLINPEDVIYERSLTDNIFLLSLLKFQDRKDNRTGCLLLNVKFDFAPNFSKTKLLFPEIS